MHQTLAEWRSLPREELFQFWQDELAFKKRLRQKATGFREIQLASEAETIFLRQSLAYGEQRALYYTILFLNMNHQAVQSAVINGPQDLYLGFLAYLPQIIAREQAPPRAMQFLINLYREDLHAYFADIVQILSPSDCDFLLERTASKGLRQLLGMRQQELAQEEHTGDYVLLNAVQKADKYPGLFGDKIQIIAEALANLQSIESNSVPASPAAESILAAADQLFMAGLLNECLTLLAGLYRQQNQEQVSFMPADNSQISKNIQKLASKLLPVYALLRDPYTAFRQSLELYQLSFPTLQAEEASLLYLDIYVKLLANYHGHAPYMLLEISQIENRKDFAGSNHLLAYLQKQDDLQENGVQLCRYAAQTLTLLPHESFVIMESMRWLERTGQIKLSRELSNQLLRDYLQLFQWIPSPLFLNREIYQQLAAGADEALKTVVVQILNLKSQYSFTELRQRYTVTPALFQNNPVAKQLLFGSFLGV